MSNQNENNRPQLDVRLGDITATTTYTLFLANKAILLMTAKMLASVQITASMTNNVEFKLVNRSPTGVDTDVAANVSTADDVAKGAFLSLNVPDEYRLEKNHSLLLTATVNGSGEFDNALISIDYQVKGN